MTRDDEAASKDATGDLLGASAEHVARFYLPGGMNYSELSGTLARLDSVVEWVQGR